MNNKKYITPQISIEKIEFSDVITTSGNTLSLISEGDGLGYNVFDWKVGV